MDKHTEHILANNGGKEVASSLRAVDHDSPSNQSEGEQKRKAIVALLRGSFAVPVIAALGESGVAERMLRGDFSCTSFDPPVDRLMLATLCDYLLSIGILKRGTTDDFAVTKSGRSILQRNGAFSLLMSYSEYFEHLPDLLVGEKLIPEVNRQRNVRGSGQLHSRKFFPAAFDLCSSESPTGLIDVGCGDGCFLAYALARWPQLAVFGVDLSPIAVTATQQRLGFFGLTSQVALTSDGFDVERWGAAAAEILTDCSNLLISFWFVAHEFSKGSETRIVEFFSAVYRAFPRAQLLLGEINRIPPDILAEDHDLSIVPEFLLFHEMSRQGVLSWDAWQTVLRKIPYGLKAERRFDEVWSSSGEAIPASFIWLLEPR